MRLSVLSTSLLFILLGGCMVGPNYQPPEVAVPNTWASDEGAKEEAVVERWWEILGDPLLTRYIERASVHNYDIQAAEANVCKAKAVRQIAASGLFPHAVADLNGTKTYFSKNGPVFAIGQATGNPADTTSTLTGLPFALQIPQIQNLFNALIDVSWELDFFGKTRRTLESATAAYESAIEQKNALLLSLFAEVAKNYIELRSAQRKSALTERNVALFSQQAAIVAAQLKAGYANQLDLENVQADLAKAEAALPDLYAEIYRAIYSLSILVGNLPETLVEELFQAAPLPKAPLTVAVGLRSDLLRRRPDVRYAERKLAEATANIGVAVASFFPSISLVANGGFQSLALPQLFEWGSRTWAYGADVSMPLFQGGRLVGSLHFARADQALAAANYQQAVLNALQEAETNLKGFEEFQKRTLDFEKSVAHNQNVVTITQERYQKGLINLLNLLQNERQLIAAELQEVESRTGELFTLISLYKALGGGWDTPCPLERDRDGETLRPR